MPLDRDNAFYNYVAPTPTVDASDAAEKARIAAMSKANAASRPATLLEQVQTQIANTQANISNLENTQAQIAAVNPAALTKAPGETNAAFNIRVKAAEAAARTNLAASDPMYNKDVQPEAPVGSHYSWIGGTTTGSWQLYKDPSTSSSGGGSSSSSSGSANGAVIKYDANGKPIVTDVNPISADTRDAFAALTDLFTSYGLGSLANEISGYMTSGKTASEALIALKTNPTGAYAERFAGNFARAKSGLNVLSESDYITNENSYAETLKAYGLGDMLSVDPKNNWKTFATYIANDVSPVEFKERIKTVEDRVINADAETKATFKEWYPSITDKDLVAYFLDPTRTLDKLKAKTAAADIGAAFRGQGLSTDMTSAEGYATYGIDRATALQGAADIKGVLPRSQDLSKIYQEAGIDYTQKTGEAEFLKTNADAAEQRRRLKSMERASFMGDSGVNSQVGSLAKNTQGAF